MRTSPRDPLERSATPTGNPAVSVIVPARDAAATLAATLASLQKQTSTQWEAIIVDDGSTDGTAAVAERFARDDPRLRLLRLEHGGVSRARNDGVRAARFEWLLFLDADDWIEPTYLERMTGALAGDASLDAVHCGWARVTPDGRSLGDERCERSGDLFDLFAQRCAFGIHACVVRRSAVERAGGFDARLQTCEDWDLWQRIARSGARFGHVGETLARYGLRADSATTDLPRLFADGLRTIALGHAADPRFADPAPQHARGRTRSGLGAARFHFTSWIAGMMLGRGEDPRSLLESLEPGPVLDLDPQLLADSLFAGAPISRCATRDVWDEIWDDVRPTLIAFLGALERHSGSTDIARRTEAMLERRYLDEAIASRPRVVGRSYGLCVDVVEPFVDVIAPSGVTRLHCRVELEGMRLGTLLLPVVDGVVPRGVLADAVAADFAWPILGRFFALGVYRDLRRVPERDGLAIYYGRIRLSAGLSADDGANLDATLHDRIGWTVFLQELWGWPRWLRSRFYSPRPADDAGHDEGERIQFDVASRIPRPSRFARRAIVRASVGGATLGPFGVRLAWWQHQRNALRSAVIWAAGFELCVLAVREALVGRPLSGEGTLRERLMRAASRAAALPDDGGTLRLGRRPHDPPGTSASRRAALPAAVTDEVLQAASATGTPVLARPDAHDRIARIEYAPDDTDRIACVEPATRPATAPKAAPDMGENRRADFESIFARASDPWGYASEYEEVKYEQTLSLLPGTPIGRALELACAEGHFTMRLAPRVGELLAADISSIALERASARCAGFDHVHFARLDLMRDALPRDLELIVCSEVLYYVGDVESLRATAQRLAGALAPGGLLLTAHAHLVVDEPERTGFDWELPFGAKVIGEVLEGAGGLHRLRELRTPLYRVTMFRRPLASSDPPPAAEIVEAQHAATLPDAVAARVLWKGGSPRGRAQERPATTERLPILMYHRVAPSGSDTLARWRVTPAAFEEQLAYLRDTGYRSVTLADWRHAAASRRALHGRAVLLTFDDGYADFAEHAWPILQRYGFGATVFLVSDRVGEVNTWDRPHAESLRLMDWATLRDLAAQGVEFGAHSASHPPLTALDPADVVREGCRSLVTLARELGRPPRAFAYPYGDTDGAVRRLIGACGYVYGLGVRTGRCRVDDPLLDLPRIEVRGDNLLGQFVAQLESD